jgi:hypothetical protein
MQKRQITASDHIIFSAVQLAFVIAVLKGKYLNSALSAIQLGAILIAAMASLLTVLKGYSLVRRLLPITSGDEGLNPQLLTLILNAFMCAMAELGVTVGLLSRR